MTEPGPDRRRQFGENKELCLKCLCSIHKASSFLEFGKGSGPEKQELRSQKTLCYIRAEGLPSVASHPQLPGLAEAPASPSPSRQLLKPRPQPGFLSKPSLSLHPGTLGQANKPEVVAEGPQQQYPPPAEPMGPQRGLDVCADDMFMAQPLLTHALGFPSLILVGWIPVLLLDLGALGLGLNRGSFNGSNPGRFQPLPSLPLDLIFYHTQLYYRM